MDPGAEAVRWLILGGTAWLGSQVARAALDRGHSVTCLARGSAGDVPEGAVLVRADRTQPDAYAEVAGQEWDVVLDVSRQPGQVRGAVSALANRARFFVFISSGNVYADHRAPGQDETADLLPALDGDVMDSMDTYGEAKVACERSVIAGFGADRSMVARVGLIGGAGDIFDRSGYWPWRFARPAAEDQTVLVPDDPDMPTQVIDVRDLATWLVEAGDRGLAGIYNATGETVPLPTHLAAARTVAGHTGPLAAASPAWLLTQGVEPWMGERSMPLWLSDPAWRGFNARDSSRARIAGLRTRPLEETLADTLAWELSRDPNRTRRAGLSDADERRLLAVLART